MNIKLEYLDLDKMEPNPLNSKIHTEQQIEQIKKSIKTFGFNDPIAIDENNTIIEGHGRYIAAKELELKKVPVIILSHLTKQQMQAYSIIHNKLTTNTGFNLDILQDELDSIKSFDMSEYSFDLDDISYFDDTLQPKEKDNIIVIVEKDKASELAQFLDDNGYKYRQKNVR